MLYAHDYLKLSFGFRIIRLVIIYLLLTPLLFSKPLNTITTLSIDKIEGNGLVLEGITSTLDTSDIQFDYRLKIKSLSIPEKQLHINNINIKCEDGVFTLFEIKCSDGKISFVHPVVSAKEATIVFSRLNNGSLEVQINNFEISNGKSSVKIATQNEHWKIELDSKNISLSGLQLLLPSIQKFSPDGRINTHIVIKGNRENIASVNGNMEMKKISFTNQESTIVGENIFSKLEFQSKRKTNTWANNISSTIHAGEIYVDPIFIDAEESPKEIFGKFEWSQETKNITFSPITFSDRDSIHINVSTTQDLTENIFASPVFIDIQYAEFPKAYNRYLQPFLLHTNYSDLTVNGAVKGSLKILDKELEIAKLDIGHLTVKDNLNRFALYDLNGEIAWGAPYDKKNYNFEFNAANLYDLMFGKGAFEFSITGDSLVLKEPTAVAILDGEIRLEKLTINHPGNENRSIDMDVSLLPISMQDLSAVFNWPKMSGTLSGYAPNIVYKNGNVDIQGALLIRAFDGTTTIHNLQVKELFSPLPKLFADIQIKNLDLQPLTETFSFGEITGRLDGYINELQLLNWKPIHFDAWLGTPINDSSRHRISQTAVDNLTKVGNGAPNIFSKGFLRFLDSFGYDRIGIGCKLENLICSMRGVANSDRGFYIVKGSGIPRIDIIGFTNEVSWPVLTERLSRIIHAQPDN